MINKYKELKIFVEPIAAQLGITLFTFVYFNACGYHFQLLGLATIVVNALAIKDMAPDGRAILWVFIAVGSIVFLTSFIGCFGAIKENICLTWTVSNHRTRRYILILFIPQYAISMLALLIISVVVLFVFRMHIEGATTAEDELNLAWDKQRNGTDAMAEYQKKVSKKQRVWILYLHKFVTFS